MTPSESQHHVRLRHVLQRPLPSPRRVYVTGSAGAAQMEPDAGSDQREVTAAAAWGARVERRCHPAVIRHRTRVRRYDVRAAGVDDVDSTASVTHRESPRERDQPWPRRGRHRGRGPSNVRRRRAATAHAQRREQNSGAAHTPASIPAHRHIHGDRCRRRDARWARLPPSPVTLASMLLRFAINPAADGARQPGSAKAPAPFWLIHFAMRVDASANWGPAQEAETTEDVSRVSAPVAFGAPRSPGASMVLTTPPI